MRPLLLNLAFWFDHGIAGRSDEVEEPVTLGER
jgi:hypothetical protein